MFVTTASQLISAPCLKAESRARPNIVFILADDMGYGDPSCQNPQSKIATPNMDRLARQGIRFTDAHSPSSVCTPTRYGILTGRFCWRTWHKRWAFGPWTRPLIKRDRLTLPELLKQYGYDTAAVGKWHLGMSWPTTDGKHPKRNAMADNVDFRRPIEDGPVNHGFDYYFGVVAQCPPYCYIENDQTIGVPTEPKPKAMVGLPGPMLPGWNPVDIMPNLTEKAVAYIDRQAKKDQREPFFLYFALTAPHVPIAPAPRFKGKSKAGLYGDFVQQVDWTIGQVMEALARNGLEDGTLLIVTSDNGSHARDGTNMCGPVGSVKKYGHNPSGKLRGLKADAWDGGHRVPFIARWPGKIASGTTSDETISTVDMMATVAVLLGVKLPDDAAEDSYNILPALLGHKLDGPIREATVHHSGDGMFAIRQGPWKLILGRGSGGFSRPCRIKPKPGEPTGQLYNLEKDPAETTNLYQQHPEVVQRLTGLLEKYKEAGRSAPRM